jgi:hypothetical protein
MPPHSKLNLNPIRLPDMALAIAAFAAGIALGLLGLSLVTPEDPDLGPFLFVLVAIPLAISPFIYVIGYFLQETVLPQRSRPAQLVSGIVSGVVYVLLLGGAMAVSNFVERFLELPPWVSGGVFGVLFLGGPLFVALISSKVERRLAAKSTIEVHNAR